MVKIFLGNQKNNFELISHMNFDVSVANKKRNLSLA